MASDTTSSGSRDGSARAGLSVAHQLVSAGHKDLLAAPTMTFHIHCCGPGRREQAARHARVTTFVVLQGEARSLARHGALPARRNRR
jgi:hypothetical protein